MRIHRLVMAVALLLGLVPAAANAFPITYTLSGTIDGAVNTTPFFGRNFIWTMGSDTSLISSSGGITIALAVSDTIKIAGVGTLLVADPSAFALQPSGGVAGFFVDTLGEGATFGSPAMIGYDGRPTGPMTVSFLNDTPVPTDQGSFAFAGTLLTFQASTVPEPLTLAMFGVGLIGLGVIRRRKQRA